MKTINSGTILALALVMGWLGPAYGFQGSDEEAIVNVLNRYAAAVENKALEEVEACVDTSEAFTMFEGGHINWGWKDYRDNHLAPELQEFLEIRYGFEDIKPHVLGTTAYATLRYNIAVRLKDRDATGEGLTTLVLTKQNGDWKIVHMHTSRIPKPRR